MSRTRRLRAVLLTVAALSILPAIPVTASSEVAIPGPAGRNGVQTPNCYIPPNRDIWVTRKVYEVGQRRNVSPRVMLAGFEAGWVESRMNNLRCGDRDSQGVFQQRPSQGWGTVAQVTNVDYAANKFFEVAQQMEPRVGGTAGQLAQAVQRSAFPERYDQAEGIAIAQRDEAFQPYGRILEKWNALGGAGGVLGAPVRAEADAKLGGRFVDFRNGMILWRPDVAWAVRGQILFGYRSTGSELTWGFPLGDEGRGGTAPNGNVGAFQRFEKALFLQSGATGPHAVHGEILKKFEAEGNERKLGYPKTDEIPEGTGFRQVFEEATIHWNPSQGAWVTRP